MRSRPLELLAALAGCVVVSACVSPSQDVPGQASSAPPPGLQVVDASAPDASAAASESGAQGMLPAGPEASVDGPATEAGAPFTPEPPTVYVAKVKNILVGLPPTDAEIKAVQADPTQLAHLIDGWMTLPQYTQKMMRFFELAFQQTQISAVDFADETFPRQPSANGTVTPQLMQNTQESFARTMLAVDAAGKPFTSAMTTQAFMMTPALMELYAFLDAWQVDDAGKVTDRFHLANPKLNISVEAAAGPIPLAQTLDPTSANYMVWYDPDVANAGTTGMGCAQDPIVYPAAADTLHYIITGSLLGRKNPTGGTCGQLGGTAAAPQLVASDFTTWKMVTVRAPKAGESPTAFYDLATLRNATELVLVTPRVGFFTTPAFFANWQTNSSNQMRVTMNQTLIVATGAAVDGTDPTVATSTPGLDAVHSSTLACSFCHRTLDPTRSILSATYSWNYHQQDQASFSSQPGLFVFQGVTQPVQSVADLGATLASHPLLPTAWAQKLCYYANSAACVTTDPEFSRVVGVFVSSGYSWRTLVREILSSPLTTHAAPTQTATDDGEVVAVSRRDHFCAALNDRLGLTDVCGLDAETKAAAHTAVPEIVSGLPSDGYGRGAIAPVLPNSPSLFFRSGVENICEAVASLVIDLPASQAATSTAKQWSSTQPQPAITDFVQTVMGLTPSDPRSAQAVSILSAHFSAAVQSGATASNALKSTFVVACLAPSSVSIGL